MDNAIIHRTRRRADTGMIMPITLFLVGIVSAIICTSSVVCEGLEFLFVLPLSFSVSRIIFARAYSYWKENIAFTVIFASIYARYIVTPLLMTFSGTALTTVYPTVSGYRFALGIMVFELFATLIIIDVFWTRHKSRDLSEARVDTNAPAEFRLSILGFLFIAALVLLVFSRGHLTSVFSHFSTWWYVSEDTTDLFLYDLMAIDLTKSIVAITIISVLARIYRKSSSSVTKGICFLGAFAVGLLTTVVYQYTQRTALAQLILSVMIMLFSFFPERRKFILTVFGIGGTAFVFYTFATGSMQIDESGIDESFFEKASKMGELYVTGPSMVAITQDKLEWVRSSMSFSTYLSDIINTTHVIGLFPFLRGITGLVSGVPTSNQLFVDSLGGLTYILPNYSFWTYYATKAFGWAMEIISIIVTVKLICFVDTKKKKSRDACFYYTMAYIEILLGQIIFVNNSFLFWHAFTNLPFWLLVFSLVNYIGNRIRLK